MKIEDLEKALQYFTIAVPENEEQAKAYFWARKGIITLQSTPEGADTNVGGRSWISVENRLPKEKDGRVLVFHPDDFRTKINVAQYSEYSDMWYIGDMYAVSPTKPTHWMPLPEPPEVKDHG